ATGVLTRLSVERELPRSLGAAVAQALNDALGAGRVGGTMSFEGGVESALRRMPLRLVGTGAPGSDSAEGHARTSAEGFKRWADAVATVTPDPFEQERMLTEALEQVLVSGPEPDADQAAYEA